MSTDNYYKILEIPETSTKEDIKKAYRKLSLKWHPDKNQNNPDASAMFQKISEAYETLGDENKRNTYDMMQKNPFMSGQSMPFSDMDDMFSMFFGGPPNMGMNHHQQGFPPGFPPGMAGLFGGSMGGSMGGPNIRIFRNGVQVNNMMEKPTPIIKNITITMEQVLTGGKIPIDIERWILENNNKVFEKVTIYVELYKGIDNNEIIILRDQGNVLSENCKGDVKVFIKVDPHNRFERNGLELIFNQNISLKESLCGFSFDLKHLNGKSYTINNKAGNIIPPNYEKVIPNMGLIREEHTGALIIKFNIQFPETLTSEQIDSISKILI